MEFKQLSHEFLRLTLRPIVRFWLKQGNTIQDFWNYTKAVFVEVAQEEIGRVSSKVNVSRVTVLTGLNRKEVARVMEGPAPEASKDIPSLLMRVTGQWEQDPNYLNSQGKPRVLTYEGESCDLRRLISSVNKDINPGSVLFELIRSGAAQKTRKGLKLLKRVPSVYQDPKRAFEILSKDIESLISAVDQNVFHRREAPNLHIRTEYDNVFQSQIPKIRQWILDEGAAFHKRARDYISKFDQDLNPGSNEQAGAKVAVGTFSFTIDEGDLK